MKKLLVGLVAFAVFGIIGFQLFGEQIVNRAVQRQITANLEGAGLMALSDGLNVVLCGAGSPLPDPERAGPCTLVIAGDQMLVVDVGSGSPRNFGPMGIPAGQIDALLLTHFHSDHIDGFGELMLQRWAGGGLDQPMPVYGPPGVESIVAGFNRAYEPDFGYRVAHHGESVVPPDGAGAKAHPYPMPDAGGDVVYDVGGLKVTAFPVDHAPVAPAVGYRFDYKGRSAVISGDTARSENVQRIAQGADLLVHEALAPHLVKLITEAAEKADNPRMATITRDILDYHTSPVAAAEIAAAAGVDYLLYNHIVPPLPVALLEKQFVEGVDAVYDGPVTVGSDGDWVGLPSDSDEIESGNLVAY